MTTQNPLLEKFVQKDQAVPFDLIKTEHFLPALDEAIKQAQTNVDSIKKNKTEASFENTIVALETCSELVERVVGIYGNLESAHASEEHQALAKDIYPKYTAFSSDVSLDEEIFRKVKVVYDKRNSLDLNKEQIKLLEKTYLSFTRNGALLDNEGKEKLRAIDQELSVLGPKFSEHVLKATNSFEMLLDKKSDLDGLPEGAVEAAAHIAESKGHKGQWLFNLQMPSYLPFLTYAKNRTLREKMWRAYNSKAFNDKYDNQENVKKIVSLRHQRAQLLGFKTHADFVLAERMAKDPGTVKEFLTKLLEPSKGAAQKDFAEVVAFAKETEGVSDLQPWDFGYYSEKLKEKKYSFNEEDLRPYFKLENVVEGVFEHARRLYGLTFKENKEIPAYHSEVKVYEVFEEKTGKYVSLFYTDFFPRETKKGGAWMTTFRDQGLLSGDVKRPHVSIVCNFTKPTPTKPSLLSYDEVRTLFHEFGHALHGMLSDCTYRSLSGTNVYWDFVELPSQIMENWVGEKEGLDVFAKHYETNAPIPTDLVEKIKRSSKFQAGWASLRQLQFGLLDMSWHSQDPSKIANVDDFEVSATALTRILPKIPGTNSSCSFSHIFAGGYSAGYYSYKWAEVLDADAFEFFQEKGLFNNEVAQKFKDNVLSRGGTEHPMELYKKFRGREPDPNALLRRDGLI
ncbi:M3 family metallopeptidase [Bdellovibrio sp. HCB337]|uniref:M3 family metallopeptidase n=1 Tax=Bdellovibrio sp. HCB337 TaxID=3394358 RepID=UPI0039A5BA07